MTIECNILDGIAVVTIDNPPVNALSTSVRSALLETADKLDANPKVEIVLLCGAGKSFVGGADLGEFDRPLERPYLPDLISRIERAAKPWIAIVNGPALGGGLELCLGCAYRIALDTARFALPEVNLGIIPGAGGTQRLPRLIDTATALDVAAGDRSIDAAAALDLGLVDEIIAQPALDAAIGFARRMKGQPRPAPLPDRMLQGHDEPRFGREVARILRDNKDSASRMAAIEAFRRGIESGFEAGLAYERRTFLTLRESQEAKALRYLFFAERAAPRPSFLRDVRSARVERVGVVGGGTMGVGIGVAFRQAGFPVSMVERDEESLKRAVASFEATGDSLLKRGRLTPAQRGAWSSALTASVELEAMSGCDLVVEAVFEDEDVKREVFESLAAVCSPDCILATNTSYIDPRRFLAGLPGQHRLVGMHFFSPAHVMKLLEIIPTPDTSPQVLAATFDIARKLGKIPVRSGICDGFIGNRILRRYRTEAENLLREGVAVQAVDAAMRGFGYAMGPFEMQDLAGLDISFRQREAARRKGLEIAETPGDLLVRSGRLGQKSGAGWYDYAAGSRSPIPSAAAAAIIAPITGRPIEMEAGAIVGRLLAAMTAEGRAILNEGIAASATDIDLVEVHGYGFPRSKGGPMFQESLIGAEGNLNG